MSLREGYSEPGLPTTHYFLSLSRGDAIRTIVLRPVGLWMVAGLVAFLIVWAAAVSAYLAFHDDLLSVMVARQAEMRSAYERRLAEAGARIDEAASGRELDLKSFAGKLNELMSRQGRLEKRGAIVAALAAETDSRVKSARAGSPADALGAIQALAPAAEAERSPPTAPAYAPLASPPVEPRSIKPHPIDEEDAPVGAVTGEARPAAAAAPLAADDPDPAARLAILDRSLERMDNGQMKALAAIDRSAERAAARDAAVVARTGLDPAKLTAPRGAGGVGGPFIPAEIDPKAPAFELALTRTARDVATAERLKALMPFVPVRMPLFGDASISSPFGYRADPFLGRLALHPGVDLTEAWGAEIHATGAGRVTHAGPMGGYGNMVEIDHGNGLVTRYAHMSKVTVEEGQDVAQGAVLGKMGSSGRSTGPHLHYEVRVDGEPVDPERYLRAGADLTAAE